MRNRLLAPLSVLTLTLPLLGQTQAPPRAVEDLLPASTYACARFGGLAEYRKAVDQMPMAELVRGVFARMPAETVDEHFHQGIDEAAAELRNELTQVGIKPGTLRTVLHRPMALGVGRPTLHGMGPSVALLIDAGPAMAEVHELVQALTGFARQMDERIVVGKENVAGVEVQTLQPDEGPQFLMGQLGPHFVITNSRGYLGEIAAVAAGRQPAMAKATGLGGARGHLPQAALASAYVNLQPVMHVLQPFLPYEAAELGAALGLDGVSGLYWGASGGNGGGAEVLHLGVTGSAQGLLKTAFKGPLSLRAARYCSPEAVAFAAGSLDVPAVVDAFGRFLDALPAVARDEARREMLRELRRELRHMGMTPEALDGLLRAFGHNVAFAVDLARGTNLPEVLLFVEVKDFDAVAPLMGQMEQMIAAEAGVEWKTRKSGESEIRFCNATVEDGIALSPCWVRQEGLIVFSSHVKTLLGAINRAGKDGESLAGTDDFRAMAQECGGAAAVVHLRLKTGAEVAWKSLQGLLRGQIDRHSEHLGFGGDVLPEADEVARAVGTVTMSVHVGDDGLLVKQSGSLTGGAFLAAIGRLCDEVLDRASSKVF